MDGKSNVNLALNDFPFIVHPCSPYICKKCLTIAKKRSALRQRIQEIDLELTAKYCAKCQEAGLSLKMKSSGKSAKKLRFDESTKGEFEDDHTVTTDSSFSLFGGSQTTTHESHSTGGGTNTLR